MNEPQLVESKAAALRQAFDQSFALPPPPASQEVEDLLAIRVAGNPYAIRLRDIAGIVAGRKVVPVPAVRLDLLGLAGIRGGVVPVFGLASILGYGQVPGSRGGQSLRNSSSRYRRDSSGTQGGPRPRCQARPARSGGHPRWCRPGVRAGVDPRLRTSPQFTTVDDPLRSGGTHRPGLLRLRGLLAPSEIFSPCGREPSRHTPIREPGREHGGWNSRRHRHSTYCGNNPESDRKSTRLNSS